MLRYETNFGLSIVNKMSENRVVSKFFLTNGWLHSLASEISLSVLLFIKCRLNVTVEVREKNKEFAEKC